ncbi:MAG: pseudouridine synthase [Pseudomonadota bacterium]
MRPPKIIPEAATPRLRLPTKNGVSPSCISLPRQPADNWLCVLDYLVARFTTLTRSEIEARLLRGDITDDCGQLVSPSAPYVGNRKLYYYRRVADEPRIPFQEAILFEDELLVAVDKPHFLPVVPAGRFVQETLLVRLKQRLGIDDLAPMHRIDRETAGVVLFTKQPATRGAYQTLFQERLVNKQYLAIAPWRDELVFPQTYLSRIVESDHFMRMHEVAGEPNAETVITLLARHQQLAQYRLVPITGRKHQLRVQMAALGLPIVNDQIYPQHIFAEEENMTKPLQLLAQSVAFKDPISHEQRCFTTRRKLDAMMDFATCPAEKGNAIAAN